MRLQPFESTKNQGAMCPRTRQRDIEMITARFCSKLRIRRRFHPVTKPCIFAYKFAIMLFGVVPNIVPFAFN
ncbi:Uncharacterised protein [Vibrio cholerae]|uniref:Uncharacterized protein n=1 Tax=Vibrio cholerae TaxID=666 RepID=A0A655YKV7_VIBCL|nr:Uncharacterised protein [Vibrio cholerae]CSA58869.1 Uncharacterised protein [Vibrio cholerae]CSC11732.1 Uncharacterised protein [Vibrio cholerae]CSC38249.1 Uncharacterised protein [Vibrio cholerae]CSC41751.1 Uncharacterised protein [Vibrio cholerae]